MIRTSSNHREALGAISTITGQFEYLNSTNGALDITGGSSGSDTQYQSGATQLTPTGNAILGQYSTTLPTLTTNGTLQVAQFDSNGRILTNPGALSAANDTVTSYQGGAWAVSATQSGSFNVGTATRVISTGQTTLATTATQLNVTSTTTTNGILVRGLVANASTVYIGASGVTSGTGWELAPGESVVFTVSNITALYGVNSNNTDSVCWSVL